MAADDRDDGEAQGNGTNPVAPDTAADTKATAAKGAKGRGKGVAATKVKMEANVNGAMKGAV